MSWRGAVLRRVGWSLGASTAWTWGLLLLRMVRDGLQPLEVWFGYGLSFFMTAVYVYLGLTIVATLRTEGRAGPTRAPADQSGRMERLRRPAAAAGAVGALVAALSVVLWLALRFPGPQAVSGTVASVILALMVLAVVAISTLIARGAH